MKPIYRRLLIFVIAIVIVAVGYFGYRLYAVSLHSLPQDFSEARLQGSAISEKIIMSSNDIAVLVARFSSPTSTPSLVSSTISEVAGKVGELRSQAIELAGTLEVMTKSVSDIGSSEVQRAALQAITHRLNLVNHLIVYTDEVSRLALALRLRLDNGIQNNQDIPALIQDINMEVAAVNNSSSMADEAMTRLDSLLR